MAQQKRVLVVDQDEIMRGGMRTLLEGMGFYVDEARDEQDAKKMLVQKEYFLAIAGVDGSSGAGTSLLDFVRKTGMSSRFLAVGGPAAPLDMREARRLGADGFLNKPFAKAEFSRAIDSSITNSDVSEGGSIESEFLRVPLADFVSGGELRVDLYLRMSASKFLKIGHKGAEFGPERAKSYMAKGIRWFHMRKEDFASYVDFAIDAVQAHDPEEFGKRMRLTTQVTEELLTQLADGGLDREYLEDAANVVMNAVEMIAMNTSTLNLLESMELAGSLPSHSVGVAIWSCLIARRVQWSGQSTYFKLASSALFHDAGEKELDANLVAKQRYRLTRDERRLLESHTFRGRDILQTVAGMPEDAALVALQHHELFSGGGYPYGLKGEEIHPFARLVAVADRFCELLREEALDKKPDLPAVFEKLAQNARDYDPEFLQALHDIIMQTGEAGFDSETEDGEFGKRGVN